MTCVQASELLAAYADGGLEGKEQGDVAAHVRGCSACGDEVRVLRELLADTRHLTAPPARDEVFWNDLARDIRVAVSAEKKATPWWRLPARMMTTALAMAAVAVLWVGLRRPHSVPVAAAPVAAVTATIPVAPRPLPRTFDLEDLDGAQLDALSAALSPDEDAEFGDDELAVSGPAVAEAYLENFDDTEVAKIATAL